MKRLLTGFFVILMLFSCLPVLAETVDEEALKRDRARIRWGIAMTAEMAGCAQDHAEAAENEEQRTLLARFSGVDFMSPDKAIVLELDQYEMNRALTALQINGGRDSWADSSPALADLINSPLSEDYARASRLALAEGKTTQEYSQYFVLILLPYGEDIAIVSLTAYGPVNSKAAFISSTPEISRNLGLDDISRYLDQLGLQAPRISVYEQDALDALMTQDVWRGGSAAANQLANAVLASDRRREALFPALLRSDSPYISASFKYSVLNTMLARMESADLALVREVAGVWLPPLAEGQEDPVGAFLSIQDAAYNGKVAAPELTYGEEPQDEALKPDGTYLVVFETVIPDKEPTSWTDMRLEAVLPPENIPPAADEADYIIRCHTEYQGGTSMGGASLHYPKTHITVHDAKTGALLRDLGSVHRTLKGSIMLPKGDTWWDPFRTELWTLIRPLFYED
ncbi:MAG: hypothetical protein IJ246_05380 [Clostridia bacterium]|nr:hypothetical protein [Clostridia bacterium]